MCAFVAVLLVALFSEVVAAPLSAQSPASPDAATSRTNPQAAALADRVLAALGGEGAWDATRYVTWNFFGRRRHVWDKWTGDIRVEGVGREDGVPYLILMNLGSGVGRGWRGGQEVTDAPGLAALLDSGEAAWINDSYWMFMPYKLGDPGVTLRYVGPGTTSDGGPAEVLELTFASVGRTPENKYLVYVGNDSGLVEQWDFFEQASDPEPGLSTPWRNWRRYGAILLSDDRGERKHTGIAVFDELPATVLGSPDPVDWAGLGIVD
jgi:hypothetical protein